MGNSIGKIYEVNLSIKSIKDRGDFIVINEKYNISKYRDIYTEFLILYQICDRICFTYEVMNGWNDIIKVHKPSTKNKILHVTEIKPNSTNMLDELIVNDPMLNGEIKCKLYSSLKFIIVPDVYHVCYTIVDDNIAMVTDFITIL